MHEAPFAVELFRNIGDFMYAAALECSYKMHGATQNSFAQPIHLAVERGTIVLDLTPYWNRIVSTLQRARPNDVELTVALLRGIGDLVYAIADFLDRAEPKRLPK